MNLTVETNIAALNNAIADYVEASSKAPEVAVRKHGKEFSKDLRDELKRFMPAKGSVRTARLAALKAGEGLRVRAAVRAYVNKNTMATATDVRTRKATRFMQITRTGKVKRNGLSWWELAVQRELNLRERGRGYLSYSSAFRKVIDNLGAGSEQQTGYVVNRYNRGVSKAKLTNKPYETSVAFNWGETKASAGPATVLNQPRGQAAIGRALASARENIVEYMNRKNRQNAEATLGRVR